MGKKTVGRVKVGIILGLSILLVVMIAQNSVPVPARFLWFNGQVSAVVLLILSATTGFILGLIVALSARRKKRGKSTNDSESGAPNR